MSYEAYHLAVVHVLLRRRGDVFQLLLAKTLLRHGNWRLTCSSVLV